MQTAAGSIVTEPQVRLHLFFATENDRAVVMRQGPSRHFRLILWHRDDDRFDDGQWVIGKVYVERCAISPDGMHLVYFLLDGRWNSEARGAFTAISRPPHWTAVALFPKGNTWGGGGFFIDRTHVVADGDDDIIGRADLRRVTIGEPDADCATGVRLINGKRAPLSRATVKQVLAPPVPSDAAGIAERLMPPPSDAAKDYATEGGKLFRRRGDQLELIRDFTDMTFSPVRAPYDHKR